MGTDARPDAAGAMAAGTNSATRDRSRAQRQQFSVALDGRLQRL